jgi:hypothetical protein
VVTTVARSVLGNADAERLRTIDSPLTLTAPYSCAAVPAR